MEDAEYEALRYRACQRTQERIEAAKKSFGVGSYRRFEVDLPTSKIRFLDEHGVERVSATVQVAGSWAPRTESWLWAWDNESVPPAARSRMSEVQAFGERNGIEVVEGSFEPCDESEAWSMASIAAEVLGAECVYRVPQELNHLFLLLFAIQKVT